MLATIFLGAESGIMNGLEQAVYPGHADSAPKCGNFCRHSLTATRVGELSLVY